MTKTIENNFKHDHYHEETLSVVYKWLGVKTSDDCYSDEDYKQTFIKVTSNEDFNLLKESFESYHQTEVDYISLEVVTSTQDENYFQILVCDSDGETYESTPVYFLEWKPKKSVYNKLKKMTYMNVKLQD